MLTELMECYNNRKLISKDFIEYFIFYYVDLLGLEQVVKGISFSRSVDTLVAYSPRRLSVTVSRNNTFNKMLITRNKRIEQTTNLEILIMCIRFLEMLFHELAHANQEMIIRGFKETNPIIKETLLEDAHIFRWQYHLYDKHYDDFITEYNAEIMSKVMISHFLNEYNLLAELGCFNVESELSKMITNYYIKNDETSFPIVRFKSITDNNYSKEDIMNEKGFNSLTEFDKIQYGMPLCETTTAKVQDLPKVKIKSFEEYFNKNY